MHWLWEPKAIDLLNVRKFCQGCSECKQNFVRDVLKERKLGKRCTEREKSL